MRADVILATATPGLIALRQKTQSVPIIFVGVSDPVMQGLVPNLNYPGGNITGFATYEFSISAKWLGFLKEIVPSLAHVVLMFNPDTSPQSKFFFSAIEAAAPAFSVDAIASPIHEPRDIDRVVEQLSRTPNSGLLLPTDNFLTVHRDVLANAVT